jgi:hypothetical protein
LQVGWARPIHNGVVTGAQLTPGATLTFELPAALMTINNMVGMVPHSAVSPP